MSETTKCGLCPFLCELAPSEVGKCRVRGNVGGEVGLLTYGKVTTLAMGPVEDKPLAHFLPGGRVLSVGGAGCNMFCGYCQNFEISQSGNPASEVLSPDRVADVAVERGADGVAFTYSEPVVWYEYVMDVALAARGRGLRTILKTNGYADTGKFESLCSVMDAVNIDVKGGPRFYEEVCGVRMPPLSRPGDWVVFNNVSAALRARSHLELSVMVVPGYEDELRELFRTDIGCPADTPLHLLKFVPDFRMRDSRSSTNEEILEIAGSAKKSGYVFVYIDYAGLDNITECPECGEEVLARSGLEVVKCITSDGTCPRCGADLNIVI